MLSTNLLSRSLSSAFHPSWSTWKSSALLCGLRSLTLWSKIDQRFSIGLRSADQYGKRWMPLTWMNAFTRFAECLVSLSC